jgi:hypothetical protein
MEIYSADTTIETGIGIGTEIETETIAGVSAP